ncbi:uncharacterized protein PpBr36_05681 [Pyricularia pennisetigena]|uniref:uncharacterized protein n=1 Tax=Pyricularia pennisetigena TaxID=1578925 RepID=UPI00114D9A4E|nr:uncharacterized protein PpBr36_05681 [Pyricularia pennisetigena]TLS23767.1 hypothetical protein PpBr36_05681 [Pyricularia pennisetigena]
MAASGSANARPVLTHFLAIPLVPSSPASPVRTQLSRALSAFRDEVTTGYAVPPDAVRPLGTLHLTLGVMALGGNNGGDLARAVALLRIMKPREMLAEAAGKGDEVDAGGAGLAISLRGLSAMQKDPSKATVLYAQPTLKSPLAASPSILQSFCERAAAMFKDAGLMVAENRPLKLHATVVNTIYAKSGQRSSRRGSGGGGKRFGKDKVVIDATGILDQFEDYVWAEDLQLNKLVIYKMGAKKICRESIDGGEHEEEDAAYEVEAEVEI